jgi:hypothetical protein
MGRPKGSNNKKQVEQIVDEVIEKVIEKVVVENIQTSFDVVDNNGNDVRTYSIEIHGETAKEKAQEFANKINGSIK